MVICEEVNEKIIDSIVKKDKLIDYFFTRNKLYSYFNKVTNLTKKYGKKNIGYKETQEIMDRIMKVYSDWYYNMISKEYVVNNFYVCITIVSMISEDPLFNSLEHYKNIMFKAIELSYNKDCNASKELIDYCNSLLGTKYTIDDIDNYVTRIQEIKKRKEEKSAKPDKLLKQFKKLAKSGKLNDLMKQFGIEENSEVFKNVGNINTLGD